MSKKNEEPIHISVISSDKCVNWLKEIENANFDYPEEITGSVINPDEPYPYLSEESGGKIFHRGLTRIEEIKPDKGKNEVQIPDAIIPRISGKKFQKGLNIIRFYTNIFNTFSTALASGLSIASDKWISSVILQANGIRVPNQVLVNKPQNYDELFDLVNIDFKNNIGGVGKKTRGSQGKQIFILETELAAKTALGAMENDRGSQIVLQRFIDTGTPASDLRIWVVGAFTKQPKLFAMKRFALENDFRSNVSLSKSAESVDLTDEEKKMAINACKALNLQVAAVDLMRDENQNGTPYCIEINGNGGLFIQKVIKENIVRAVIDFTIDEVRKARKNKKLQKTFSPETEPDFQNRMFGNSNSLRANLNQFEDENIEHMHSLIHTLLRDVDNPEKSGWVKKHLHILNYRLEKMIKIKNRKYEIN